MTKYLDNSDASIIVYMDKSYHGKLKALLKDYKAIWGSIAHKIAYTDKWVELTKGSTIILPAYMQFQVNPLDYNRVIMADMDYMTIYDLRRAAIETSYKYTTDYDEAKELLDSLGDVFAFDSETTGLDFTKDEFTMFSFADNEEHSIVLSNDNGIEQLVLDFLTTTDKKVIVHNLSFDMKFIRAKSGKFIKNFEDTQLLARAYTNNSNMAKVGLKNLAGNIYGDWAVSKDLFGLEHKYSESLIKYAGIDACACMFLWNKYSKLDEFEPKSFSELFPILPPTEHEENPRFFYENVLKPLVPSIIDTMINGIRLDAEKVDLLSDRLAGILDNVHNSFKTHPLIEEFRQYRFIELAKNEIARIQPKLRGTSYYLKEYKNSDMVHRSYLVNTYLKGINVDMAVPTSFLPNGAFKWSIKAIKTLAAKNPLLHLLMDRLDRSYLVNTYINVDMVVPTSFLPNGDFKWSIKDIKTLAAKNPSLHLLSDIVSNTVERNEWVDKAMEELAIYKATMYNTPYLESIQNIDMSIVPEFNPGSSLQLGKLFKWLGVEPIATSKTTNEASWGRKQIEEVMYTTDNDGLKEICKLLIDFSQTNIIQSTFIPAFKYKTHEDRLHGNIRIAGAKTMRPTSDTPRLLGFI